MVTTLVTAMLRVALPVRRTGHGRAGKCGRSSDLESREFRYGGQGEGGAAAHTGAPPEFAVNPRRPGLIRRSGGSKVRSSTGGAEGGGEPRASAAYAIRTAC